MNLHDIVQLRNRPLEGVYFSLTQRCPLHCAHCSTSSTLAGEQIEGDRFVALARSMPYMDTPKLVYFTGGEPLLRPQLISRILDELQPRDIRTVVLTGAYFLANRKTAARSTYQLLQRLDHVTISVDKFHDAEVDRRRVFDLLEALTADGVDVSIQLTAVSEDDPYAQLAEYEVRSRLPEIDIYHSYISRVGRANDLSALPQTLSEQGQHSASPCAAASWPVITWSGRVTACCNQAVVTGPAPRQLELATQQESVLWPEVYARYHASSAVEVVRVAGPDFLPKVADEPAGKSYCDRCIRRMRQAEDDQAGFDAAVLGQTQGRAWMQLRTIVEGSLVSYDRPTKATT